MVSYEPFLHNLFNLLEVNIGTLLLSPGSLHFLYIFSQIKTTITKKSFFQVRTESIRGEEWK